MVNNSFEVQERYLAEEDVPQIAKNYCIKKCNGLFINQLYKEFMNSPLTNNQKFKRHLIEAQNKGCNKPYKGTKKNGPTNHEKKLIAKRRDFLLGSKARREMISKILDYKYKILDNAKKIKESPRPIQQNERGGEEMSENGSDSGEESD